MAKEEDSSPTIKVQRMEMTAGATRWYADEWEAFTMMCEQRRMKPTDQIRRLVRDFMEENFFTLTNLKPEVLNELKMYANEIGVIRQAAAERIISDFLVARLRNRSRRKNER